MSIPQRIALWEKDVPGGVLSGEAPSLDPYIVSSPQKTGMVIVFPGGGYGNRAPHEGEPIAKMLNDNGISAAVCSYRVAPHRHPSPLMDAKRAVRLVRSKAAEWNIDADHVGVLGFSAGGHLASTIATHWQYNEKTETADAVDALSARPDTAILCYAVVSFIETYGHMGSAKNLLGDPPPEDLMRFLSNEKQVTPETPPCFLWHTADDPGVPVDNSFAFASALRKNGVACEVHAYESGRHGLGLAADIPYIADWTTQCVRWLKRRGW